MASRNYVFLLFISLSSSPMVIAEQVFQSGPAQTVMIELYTSEGCNSCPPAESFLNSFVDYPGLWQTYIPLAFHVDYWDYLGWRDAYATSAHTRRQKNYGRVLQARTIYTPEFFVNGREWRRGFLGRPPSPENRIVGKLKAVLKGRAITADFKPQAPHTEPLQLNVAVLGMALPSTIRAGENAGRSTVHQFVVLGHTQSLSDRPYWQTLLPPLIDVPVPKKALVVWVSKVGNPAPLQATGGYLATASPDHNEP